MQLTRFTSVARLLDPRYATNLAIILLAGGIGIVATLLQLSIGSSLIESLLWGIGAAAAVFFAWAISRELDPDHGSSAFVAAVIMIAAVLLVGEVPKMLPLIWLLISMRVINRTTGLPSKLLDSLAVLTFGAWLALAEIWVYAALSALALLIDGALPPRRNQPLAMAGIGFLITLGAVALNPGLGDLYPSAGIIAFGMSVFFLPVTATSQRLVSTGDYTGEPLQGRRVQGGHGLALLSGNLIALGAGTAGLINLQPLWAAVLGTSLTWAAIQFRGRAKQRTP